MAENSRKLSISKFQRKKSIIANYGSMGPVASEHNRSSRDRFKFLDTGTNRKVGRLPFNSSEYQPGEIQWLETSTIRQRSITRTPQNPIVRQPNIMAKATTQRAKSIQQTPSSIRRMPANTANKRIPKVSSKSEH